MAEQLLMVGSSPVTMQQRVGSGDDFDGAAPGAGTIIPTLEPGWIKYAESNQGGKFQFGTNEPQVLRVVQIWIKFGGQTSWSLSVVMGTDEVVAFSGTTETELFKFGGEAEIIIPPGGYLKLVTSGGSTAMFANVSVVGDGGADGLV